MQPPPRAGEKQVRVRVRVRAIPNPNPNPNQYFATDHTPLVNGGLALQPGFALDAAQQVELVRVRVRVRVRG